MRVVARDGDAVLIADGDVGVMLLPDGRYQVALVGSLAAQGDWEPSDGPMPAVPAGALAELAEMKRNQGQP